MVTWRWCLVKRGVRSSGCRVLLAFLSAADCGNHLCKYTSQYVAPELCHSVHQECVYLTHKDGRCDACDYLHDVCFCVPRPPLVGFRLLDGLGSGLRWRSCLGMRGKACGPWRPAHARVALERRKRCDLGAAVASLFLMILLVCALRATWAGLCEGGASVCVCS